MLENLENLMSFLLSAICYSKYWTPK